MFDFGLALVGVPVDQDSDTHGQTVGDVNLLTAEEGYVDPPQVSSGFGWKRPVQI